MDKEPLLSKDSHYSSNDEQPLVSDNDKVQLLPNKAELELGNEPDGLEDDEGTVSSSFKAQETLLCRADLMLVSY